MSHEGHASGSCTLRRSCTLNLNTHCVVPTRNKEKSFRCMRSPPLTDHHLRTFAPRGLSSRAYGEERSATILSAASSVCQSVGQERGGEGAPAGRCNAPQHHRPPHTIAGRLCKTNAPQIYDRGRQADARLEGPVAAQSGRTREARRRTMVRMASPRSTFSPRQHVLSPRETLCSLRRLIQSTHTWHPVEPCPSLTRCIRTVSTLQG